MNELQDNTDGDTEKNADLIKINELIDRLDLCTSLPEQNSDTYEINNILSALKDHLTNPSIKNRLISNEQIQKHQLPIIFIRFCKISITFSSSLSKYSLFMTIMLHIWNMICSKLGELIDNEILSAKEYYAIAMDGFPAKLVEWLNMISKRNISSDPLDSLIVAISNISQCEEENYCTKSDSCRVEATYAIKLKIPIIALYIDENYPAEPWLDIHLTGLHAKFGKKPFAERIARLATYITARNTSLESMEPLQTQTGHSSHEVFIPSTVKEDNSSLKVKVPETNIEYSMPKTSPCTWSKAEIRAWWCTERTLIPQLCTFYDGEALCVYAQIFLNLYQQNPLTHLQNLRKQSKREHSVDFYDDHYANMVSSMMWIAKQNENDKHAVNKNSTSVLCVLL
ncbi:unnamed protein product [Rotaria sordida]|uniref:Uncharacterized protein n=1 Tax=Rotaria sordida TaxID=392033 RepID=A0A815ET39_9BILA|nr:unnamed protein product [Rotaria sordida]